MKIGKETELDFVFDEIGAAFDNGNFDGAIELANTLPEPGKTEQLKRIKEERIEEAKASRRFA